jgi:hypothetical protein
VHFSSKKWRYLRSNRTVSNATVVSPAPDAPECHRTPRPATCAAAWRLRHLGIRRPGPRTPRILRHAPHPALGPWPRKPRLPRVAADMPALCSSRAARRSAARAPRPVSVPHRSACPSQRRFNSSAPLAI